MIKEQSKLLYHWLHLIVNSLRHFNDFLKLNSVFRADETECFTEILSISPGNLVYEQYEADTEAYKVTPHHRYVFGSFYTFYLYGVLLQWLVKTFLITLLQKGLVCTSVKEKFEEDCRTKFVQYHKFKFNLGPLMRNIDIPLCHLNHVCDVAISCSCLLKLSGSIYWPNPDFSISNLCYQPLLKELCTVI